MNANQIQRQSILNRQLELNQTISKIKSTMLQSSASFNQNIGSLSTFNTYQNQCFWRNSSSMATTFEVE